MPEKRPYPDSVPDDANKRPRSNNASPAPAAAAPAANGRAADIARKVAETHARVEAVKARLNAQRAGAGGEANGTSSAAGGGAAPAAPAPAAGSSAGMTAAERIAALKARVAGATAKAAPTPSTSAIPAAERAAALAQSLSSRSTQQPPPPPPPPPSQQQPQDDPRSRGGLNIGLHPALMGDASRSKISSSSSRFSTTLGNQRVPPTQGKGKAKLDLSAPTIDELKQNPYFDASISGGSGVAKSRGGRLLKFHQKGEFIAQAAALRRQAELEAMKKRIADQARRANLEEASERSFLVPMPPEIEWWDEGLVNGSSYSALDDEANIKLEGDDSVVTIYIQHPVLLDPPQEKLAPAQKPMHLTKTEQAKLRRQRRNAEHKEQQAKIRLGLEPPPPPKVKQSNMIRVLGEQAVKDPTAVEARVNKEIAARRAKHEEENEERKLTTEEGKAKLERQQAADLAKGVYVQVYRIESLAYGKHRYKIDIHAKQYALTGVVILHPSFNLVIVEGGAWALAKYKKLMLQRVDWTENAPPPPGQPEEERKQEKAWLQALDEAGDLKDLTLNKCQLLWEGQEKARAFRKWGSRVCETDGEAKDVLTRAKMEHFWTQAKNAE